MVRPDRIAIALETAPVIAHVAGLNVLHGTVEQRLFLGPVFEYAVRCGETMLRVVSPDEVEERARVRLTFRPEDCTVLDDDTELSESDR
jgi:ABC-type Fe3+/spermidine/putrescine transport system ATPase subunit